MTQTLHTPGPWFVDACDDDLVYSAHGLRVALCSCEDQEQSDEEITANARLIAAAPELLEALAQAIEALNTVPRFKVPGNVHRHSYRIAALGDAALARARGQS